MELKKPLTVEEQLDKLIALGMTIKDKRTSEDILRKINYYRLTGYALQFRKDPSESYFVGGTTFDQIYHLYKFDERLREVLWKYIEISEIFYRTKIAYGFSLSRCIDYPYDRHYDENNFYNKTGYNEVMRNFRREQSYHKDSLIVQHHELKYSNKMPLWVMVELMSFSNLSKLYSSMYFSDKDKIAVSVGTGKETLENHLHCLSVLRNKCAHAARLYNTVFNPPAKLNKSFLRNHKEIKNNSLFAYVLILLKRLPDELSKKSLINSVERVINEYKTEIDMKLIGFPDNYFEIMSIIL